MSTRGSLNFPKLRSDYIHSARKASQATGQDLTTWLRFGNDIRQIGRIAAPLFKRLEQCALVRISKPLWIAASQDERHESILSALCALAVKLRLEIDREYNFEPVSEPDDALLTQLGRYDPDRAPDYEAVTEVCHGYVRFACETCQRPEFANQIEIAYNGRLRTKIARASWDKDAQRGTIELGKKFVPYLSGPPYGAHEDLKQLVIEGVDRLMYRASGELSPNVENLPYQLCGYRLQYQDTVIHSAFPDPTRPFVLSPPLRLGEITT